MSKLEERLKRPLHRTAAPLLAGESAPDVNRNILKSCGYTDQAIARLTPAKQAEAVERIRARFRAAGITDAQFDSMSAAERTAKVRQYNDQEIAARYRVAAPTLAAKPTAPVAGSRDDFVTPGLMRFLKQHAGDFEAADFIRDNEPDSLRRDDGDKVDCTCPNCDAHGNGDPGGFFAENAGARDSGFIMCCMHDSCKDESGGDRAFFLDKACVNYGIKDAKELEAWCPNAEKASAQASAPDEDFQRPDNGGAPYKNAHNVRVALRKLGVTVRYDVFANRERIFGLEGFDDGSELDDAALTRLWITTDEQFRFRPSWDLFCKAIEDAAYQNRYNPVDEYLLAQRWDGKPRIDTWLIDYMGAEDTPLNRECGRLWLIAAVRRARKSGAKFDQMLVLESPEGTGKSTAFATLALKDDWFTDQVPLTGNYKDVQELLSGIWIAEMGELAGLRKADVEPVKGFLARRHDRGRGAYKRKVKSQGRSCVFGGSTNDARYLKSTTGNRRFWPVRTGRINIDALKRDRDQLWAEAAKLEAEGASIVLDEGLWGEAARVQDERRTENPYVDVLAEYLGDREGGIRAVDLWKLLKIPADRQHPDVIDKVHDALRRLGWGEKRNIKWRKRVAKGWRKGEAADLEVIIGTDGTPDVRPAPEHPTLGDFARGTARWPGQLPPSYR